MKTFEEAMATRRVSNQNFEAVGSEILGRYEDLIREIGTSRSTHDFIQAMTEMPDAPGASEADSFLSLLVSTFINGVMVGIEMEKSE